MSLRIIGALFLALAVYVAVDAAKALYHCQAAGESLIGIAVAALSVIAMPLLARRKRKLAFQPKAAR